MIFRVEKLLYIILKIRKTEFNKETGGNVGKFTKRARLRVRTLMTLVILCTRPVSAGVCLFCSHVHVGRRRGTVAVAGLVAGDGGGGRRRDRARRAAAGRGAAAGGRPPRLAVHALARGEAGGHADRAGLLAPQARRRRRAEGVLGVGRARAAPVHRLFPGVARPRRHRRDQHEGDSTLFSC